MMSQSAFLLESLTKDLASRVCMELHVCHFQSVNNNNNNNLYLERVNTYVKPYGLVSESTRIFRRALTCK